MPARVHGNVWWRQRDRSVLPNKGPAPPWTGGTVPLYTHWSILACAIRHRRIQPAPAKHNWFQSQRDTKIAGANKHERYSSISKITSKKKSFCQYYRSKDIPFFKSSNKNKSWNFLCNVNSSKTLYRKCSVTRNILPLPPKSILWPWTVPIVINTSSC